MSEKIGFKAMADGKIYDIKYCDFYDNRQVNTHMPDVTRMFIDRYLRAEAKESAKSGRNILFSNGCRTGSVSPPIGS